MTHPQDTTPANPALSSSPVDDSRKPVPVANPEQVTDEQIVEIAVAHSNYKDGGEFEVFSHKRIVEFARHLMALTAAIGTGNETPAGKWAIDRSTDSPILTYENCSVIQDEQAFYVLDLIRSAIGAGDEQPFHLVEEFDDVGAQMVVAPAMGADGQAGALEPGTIRICPPRDRPCPHGLDCPYVDGYNCTDPSLSAKEGLERQIAELRAGNERLNRELNASQMQEIIGIERFLAAEVDKARLGRLLDAALSGSGADAGDPVQTGWRLVPEKLTDAMVRELERGEQDGYSGSGLTYFPPHPSRRGSKMVSIREWEQSAAEWGRRVDEAMAAKDYPEARRCLERARRHAECAVKLRNEIDKAWEACERDHAAGDNPRCFSHIYFQRGYEAACTAIADGERDAG